MDKQVLVCIELHRTYQNKDIFTSMVESCSLFLQRFLYKLIETLVENNAVHFNTLFFFFFLRILSLETELQKKESDISNKEAEVAKRNNKISEIMKKNEEK